MPGHTHRFGPRGLCRGAALTLVFASVLATAAATGSLPREDTEGVDTEARAVSSVIVPVDRKEIADAAADAEADGKSGSDAAEEVVSRSGDRWGAVYDEREYEEFEQALDGTYTGVGLSARRSARGDVTVTDVHPGGPADRAGARAGDLLLSVDGRTVEKRPVAEVVALLRGDRTEAAEGSEVVLGLRRAGRTWSVTLRRARLST
ncbi:S41 family peptidase, partial [Streptomyces sp. NRRL WC-3549]|uniref:S41 family peptidase n=1 Tax=Streptomyces sp. NRRL WC-3549 TaxID=1463925 RepID=UPI00055EB5F0